MTDLSKGDQRWHIKNFLAKLQEESNKGNVPLEKFEALMNLLMSNLPVEEAPAPKKKSRKTKK